MDTVRVTKEFGFEMAHTLEGYDGMCSQIHGHSYRLFVTVKGTPEKDPLNPKTGMVIDFGLLKKIVNEAIVERFDHSLVVRRNDRNFGMVDALASGFERVIVVDYQPTCENMVIRFAQEISKRLPQDVVLHCLRLHETATSFAEWFAEDNISG